VRWAFGLVALLLAAAAVLLLATRQTRSTFDTLKMHTPALREDIASRPFDSAQAKEMIGRLTDMLEDPRPPRDELQRAAATAAAWAAGSPPGGPEYHAAVALRSAADALLASSADPQDRQRDTARRALQQARESLATGGPPPGGPVQKIRDELQNLQNSHNEQLQRALREAH
jgi:hypothetical protein